MANKSIRMEELKKNSQETSTTAKYQISRTNKPSRDERKFLWYYK